MDNIGHVFWLFGMSGAGKSTLAMALQHELRKTASIRTLMLDGDRLRLGLCRGLGFTDLGREENLRRAGEVARLGVESGLIVIAAFITPRERHRQMLRQIVNESSLSLVHIAAPLDVCRRRDVKGLYAGAATGRVALMTGVDSSFEAPLKIDLQIDSATRSVTDCLATLNDFARRRLSQ